MISLPIKWDIQIILKFQDKLIPRKLDAQILNVLSNLLHKVLLNLVMILGFYNI